MYIYVCILYVCMFFNQLSSFMLEISLNYDNYFVTGWNQVNDNMEPLHQISSKGSSHLVVFIACFHNISALLNDTR